MNIKAGADIAGALCEFQVEEDYGVGKGVAVEAYVAPAMFVPFFETAALFENLASKAAFRSLLKRLFHVTVVS